MKGERAVYYKRRDLLLKGGGGYRLSPHEVLDSSMGDVKGTACEFCPLQINTPPPEKMQLSVVAELFYFILFYLFYFMLLSNRRDAT